MKRSKYRRKFKWEKLRIIDHLEDLSTNGGNTKMRLKVAVYEGVDCINLNQDRDKWGGGLLRTKR